MGKTFCYIGNWGKDSTSVGYTVCEYNRENGNLRQIGVQFPGLSVGAHWMDQDRGLLYTADEKVNHPAFSVGGGGEIHCFRVNGATGELELINSVPSYGTLTSYVAVEPKRKFLVCTNHGSRSYVTQVRREADGICREVIYDTPTVVLYELHNDGSIGDMCDVFFPQGSGPLPVQFMSHPHSAEFSPDGRFFIVCDKGGDQVYTFCIDREKKRIKPCMDPYAVSPGCAPRYSAFHPSAAFVYTNNESKPVLEAFCYDGSGTLTNIQEISGYAEEIDGGEKGMQSALRVSRDGSFLYSLVRMPDVISVYRIDSGSGKLTPIQMVCSAGHNLRGGTISPDGRYLLVAAIDSHEVLSYPIGSDGRLLEGTSVLQAPAPCCITFFEG